MSVKAPILIFAYGNVSRGDDGLGPLLLERIESHIDPQKVELLCDFQLQIEHALDLEGRRLVLFADAAVNLSTPYRFNQINGIQDKSYTSHAMSPEAVVFTAQHTLKQTLPPVYLLSIQGIEFELGSELSPTAKHNLAEAQKFVLDLLENSNPDYWVSAASASL
jgi:hydrogenase maturation protease